MSNIKDQQITCYQILTTHDIIRNNNDNILDKIIRCNSVIVEIETHLLRS